MRGMLVLAIAAFGAGGAANAQTESQRCFDKGTLTYYDCPRPAEQPRAVFVPPAAAPAPAPIVDDRGFYVGARGGVVFPDETDFGIAGASVENEYDMGYAIGGVVGYDFGEVTPGLGLRTDLEVGYQAAGVDRHSVGGAALAGSNGDTDVLYGFANLYGDIGLTRGLDLVLGGGVGAGQVSFDSHGATAVGTVMDDDDIAFGYHLDAGLAYALAPNVTVEAMYRYSSFIGAELTSSPASGGVATEVDVNSHQALLGLRFGL